MLGAEVLLRDDLENYRWANLLLFLYRYSIEMALRRGRCILPWNGEGQRKFVAYKDGGQETN
jgi:hypothetical protein